MLLAGARSLARGGVKSIAATVRPTQRRFTSDVASIRNIGISAHIDSGKTTLTERILFYTGRIKAIHEVKGKDEVGAKMDFMDLEREKGITIQSAATHCYWGDSRINLIDTPGHVDFTIEVERALRVLDGAILVLCGVAGVQSQSITVDRQMKRYNVPRLAFINKLDRMGSNPWKVIDQLRTKLHINCAAVQIPIGLEGNHAGVVDLIDEEALYFEGPNGETIRKEAIPAELAAQAAEKRAELIQHLADIDDHIAELFLSDQKPSPAEIRAAIRKAVIGLKFAPVFMGSAFKNRGVQVLLDGVVSYLPNPTEKANTALDRSKDEEPVALLADSTAPLVGLAFKLEEGRFGQLTFFRIYQGAIRKGDTIFNVKTGKKVKIPRLVRMHANEMQDIEEAGAGEIVALFGVECNSGDTFTDGRCNYSMTSMFVPDAVMQLSIAPKQKAAQSNFTKALSRFTKEDPTFRVHFDAESNQTIISGMGELHLEIYVERMRREYNVDCVVGKPEVNYREAITARAEFNYTHKKQSGGAGQFGKVVGYIEPLPEAEAHKKFEFKNSIIGNAIPPNYTLAVEKGFREAVEKGPLTGHPVEGIRVVLTDGATHVVDSNELAFRIAAQHAFRQGFNAAKPVILEPVMTVEIIAPTEFQGTVVSAVNKRRGMITSTDTSAESVTITADVALNSMFGFSTELRSLTQGKGEFSMEYKEHQPVTRETQAELVKEFEKKRKAEEDD
eukprot:tig00000144_g9047.t1